MKYRKKPVVIEAIIWNGKNFDEVMNFTSQNCGHKLAYEDYEEYCMKTGEIKIVTLEDGVTQQVDHIATKGDYVIKGVKGEFYACKPDIFELTYELVND